MKKVLFICTGNSARSIMAEVIMNHHGRGRYQAFSAGSAPTGVVNPHTLETLKERGLDAVGLRSKSISEFSGQDFDIVITVCDKARESCPVWPQPTKVLHWSFPDPAASEGDTEIKKKAFDNTYDAVERRIRELMEEEE